MENLDQYQDFTVYDLTTLIKKTDKFVKQGYKILTTLPIPPRGSNSGGWLRTMYLDKNYKNVVEVYDAPQSVANELLAEKSGWEVASTSVSARFYRMVKRDDSAKATVE